MENEKLEDYETLPLLTINTPNMKLGYKFEAVSFLQAQYLEERALLRAERIDYAEKEPLIASENKELLDINFRLEMAAILFTPLEKKKPTLFDEFKIEEIKAELSKAPLEAYETAEKAAIDFFTRRGKRSLVIRLLTRGERNRTATKLATMLYLSTLNSKNANVSDGVTNLNAE